MSQTVQLVAPPGYGPVTPLDRTRHAGMGLAGEPSYLWCAKVNAVYLNAVEFFRAALDYPIAFTRDERSGEFAPVAVLGLKQGQNLFVDAAGRWRPHAYVPAYFRRFPFCIAELPNPGPEGPRRLVCVQEDQLTRDSPQPLFGADGSPTPRWQPVLSLLEAVEGAHQQTRVLTRRLEALQLLTSFDAIATAASGERLRLQGLHRVDEEKLAEVGPKDLKTLLKKGELRAIHAHLISLENFARLLDYAQAPASP